MKSNAHIYKEENKTNEDAPKILDIVQDLLSGLQCVFSVFCGHFPAVNNGNQKIPPQE